jgi:hypothetical protein
MTKVTALYKFSINMNENYESSVDRVKQLTDGVERLIINLKMENSDNNMKRCKIYFP